MTSTYAARTLRTCRALLLGMAFAGSGLSLAGCDLFGGGDDPTPDDGLVHAIHKAPVAPDGDVSGRTTDLLIDLAASMAPGEPGLPLRAGDRIRVTLPDAFRRHSELPLLDIFGCLAQNLQCDTGVLLLGWPQGALGAPPPLGYEVRYEGTHTLVFTATADHLPDPPGNPGLKQIHLLLNNFTNPPAGTYDVDVTLMAADGATHGRGEARILPRTRPSIEMTNAMHEGFANGNYQETAPGTLPPHPFDLLVWDGDGQPLEGVTLDGDRLVLGSTPIGRITIDAPAGASGHAAFTEAASARIQAPVTGIPAGHLRVFFRAGSAPGAYTLTFALDGGGAVRQVVRVR